MLWNLTEYPETSLAARVSMKVFSLFLGPMVRKGASDGSNYNFYDVLRTVEGNFNIGTLGLEDASSTSIKGIWV